MGVDRRIEIRLVTNFQYFSDILKVLVDNTFSFNDDGTVMSLSENDIDEFDYIPFPSYEDVKKVLDRREDRGLTNYVVIWDKNIDDSLLINARKLDNPYADYKYQYELIFCIGFGVRIKGAERYTDFGIYLNALLPILIGSGIYICEINCTDFDS